MHNILVPELNPLLNEPDQHTKYYSYRTVALNGDGRMFDESIDRSLARVFGHHNSRSWRVAGTVSRVPLYLTRGQRERALPLSRDQHLNYRIIL